MFDSPGFGIVIGVVCLVLLIFLRFFKSIARRVGRTAGEKLGKKVASNALPKALGALGATVVIDAPAEEAHDIVTAAVAKAPKKAAVAGQGAYTVRAMEQGDVRLELAPAQGGSHLRVTEFRDYFGFPQGAPFVTDFLKRVRTEAASRGVSVHDGETATFERTELIDDNNSYWR